MRISPRLLTFSLAGSVASAHRILGSPHGSRSDRFLLRVPGNARTLHLTFALHRNRLVEWSQSRRLADALLCPAARVT
jgi:hypothetical protein